MPSITASIPLEPERTGTELPRVSRPPSSRRIRSLRGRLLDHYDRHRRELPWRGETDPYRIWVSEVILQQTRVETAIPYYRRWMERFGTLEALAEADREEVMAAWSGLGYYRRARNLHAAARLVRDDRGGELPAEPAELAALPGIGPYTAGAVSPPATAASTTARARCMAASARGAIATLRPWRATCAIASRVRGSSPSSRAGCTARMYDPSTRVAQACKSPE